MTPNLLDELEVVATVKENLIVAQQARREAIKGIVRADPKPRKRRKAITQRDVREAVNSAIESAQLELRAHKNDLPRWSQAMDFAIAVVAKHRIKP